MACNNFQRFLKIINPSFYATNPNLGNVPFKAQVLVAKEEFLLEYPGDTVDLNKIEEFDKCIMRDVKAAISVWSVNFVKATFMFMLV